MSRPVDSLDVDVEGLFIHQVRVVGDEVTVAVSRRVRQQIHVLGSRRTESHFVRVDATLIVRAEPRQLQLKGASRTTGCHIHTGCDICKVNATSKQRYVITWQNELFYV